MFRTSALVLAALLATSQAVRLESMVLKGSGSGGEDAAVESGDKPSSDGEGSAPVEPAAKGSDD